MEQNDYLKKQIDLLGKVLGKLLSTISGQKTPEVNNGLALVSQTLNDELDIDIHAMLRLETKEFVIALKTEKGFSNENLSKLAEILLIVADNTEKEKQAEIYRKCLAIYELVDKTEETYSLARKSKIEKIRNLLA